MFDINQYWEILHAYFAQQPAIVFAYLFGSHGRGTPHAQSDVDIAVLHEPTLDENQSFDLRLDLIHDLIGLLRTSAVDVIILNQAPLALSYRVFRDGVVLFSRDQQRRILFQADIVSRYLDFKPFIDYQDRMIVERARKGTLRNGHHTDHDPLAHYRQMRLSK